MAIEIVGNSKDVDRYRQYLHEQGVYTKRFMENLSKTSGLQLKEKPEGFRILNGGIKNIYSYKGKEIVKGIDNDQKLYIKGIANANIVDRCDERLDPAGIDIENFMKNQVLLLDHMYTASATVGKVISLDSQDNGVHFEAYIGDPQKAPLTQQQRDARSLVAQKLLQTVSVGFIPHKIKAPEFDDQGKLIEPAVILNWELLELSIVAVPANSGSVFEVGNLSYSLNEKNDRTEHLTKEQTSDKIKSNIFNHGVRAENNDAVKVSEDERAMEEKLIELLEELKKMGSLLSSMDEKIGYLSEMMQEEEEAEYEKEVDEEEEELEDDEEKEMDEDEEDEDEMEEDEKEMDEEDEEDEEKKKSVLDMIKEQNDKIDVIASVMLKIVEDKQNG